MISNLSLKIFYPDLISEYEINDYNEAFELWNKIWIETRQEIGETALTSDSFSRQSEIMVLYYRDRPIATCCHRYVDLRHRCVFRDSYFSPSTWPEHVREALPNLGQTCVLGSYIYIDPDFRKRRSGMPIKNIVGSLSLAHVDGTKPDVFVGITRTDRGVDKVFHNGGAISLEANARWYQFPVDLIALFPRKIPITIDPQYQSAVRSIGMTCARFRTDYFTRTHFQGGLSVIGTEESFGQVG